MIRWLATALGVWLALLAPGTTCAQAPGVSVGALPERVEVGEVFHLTAQIRWPTPAPITVVSLFPQQSAPVRVLSSERGELTQGGETVHTLTLTLVADLPGSTQLAPLTLRYRDTSDAEQLLDVPGEFLIKVVEPPRLASRLLLVTAIAGVGAGAGWLLRRRRRPAPPPPAPLPVELARQQLARAQQEFAAGRYAEVFEHLAEVKVHLSGAEDPLPAAQALRDEALKARFGGRPVDPAPLQRLIRAAEVALRPPAGGDSAGTPSI